MISLVFSLFFVIVVQCANITDKEYARLPAVFEFDNFDRCLLFEDEALYCYLEFHLKAINPNQPSKTWIQLSNLSSDPKNYLHDNLRLGVCIPISCPNISKNSEYSDFKTDLTECMNKKYQHLGVYGTIDYINCQTKEPPKFDLLDITVAILLVVYIIFVIYASFYERCARSKKSEEREETTTSKYGKIISCFSIPRNWEKLKKIEWTQDNMKFKSIQGIRFYNMLLVLVAHAAVASSCLPISNTKFTETVFENPEIKFLVSGPFGVSTFFQISAMLLSYNLWKQFDEKSKKKLDIKTIFWILLHRFVRLTPAVAVILILHSTLLYHTGRGPMWDEYMGIDKRNCRKTGWLNLLYVHNLAKPSEMCLIETWYLAVDMQSFVLVLILLYLTMKKPKRFWWFLVSAWILNQTYILFHLYRNSLFHFLRPYPENTYRLKGLYEDDGIFVKTLLYTPMNWAGTIVGTGLGFIIYKYEKLPLFNRKIRFLMWTFAIYGVAIGIIAIPGMWLFSENYYDSAWFSIPYLTFGLTIYCLAIALAIFSLVSGQGWVSKWILEWPPIYYLGRLSYSTFLAHYSLFFYMVASNKSMKSINQFEVILDTGKILAMSLVFGLILSLLVEYPISAVSTLLIKNEIIEKKQKKDEKNKNK